MSLNDIFTYYGTDKGKHYHDYGDFYETYFSKYKNNKPILLEYGIARGSDLLAINEYFDHNIEIFGVDNGILTEWFGKEFDILYHLSNLHICKTLDVNNIQELNKYLSEHFSGIDIVIDDCMHNWKQQFDLLYYTHEYVMQNDGIYILEDLHTSYPEWIYSNDQLNVSPLEWLILDKPSDYLEEERENKLREHIKSVNLWKGSRGSVTAIIKFNN
jgi:hypothetical protein